MTSRAKLRPSADHDSRRSLCGDAVGDDVESLAVLHDRRVQAGSVRAIEPGRGKRVQLFEERDPETADRILHGAQHQKAHPDRESRGGERDTKDRRTGQNESPNVVGGDVLVEGAADEEADHDEETGLNDSARKT